MNKKLILIGFVVLVFICPAMAIEPCNKGESAENAELDDSLISTFGIQSESINADMALETRTFDNGIAHDHYDIDPYTGSIFEDTAYEDTPNTWGGG